MRDVELVLRFAAFFHTHYSQYSSMRAFLNKDMEEHQAISDRDASKLRETFRKSGRLCGSLLGDKGFRRLVPGGSPSQPNGTWTKKPSAALYDVLMYGFTQYEPNQVYPHLDELREALLWLMTADQEFIRVTDNTTGSRSAVQTRFEKWMRMLDDTLGSPVSEPRTFSRDLKERLYRLNPRCAMCGARILEIDDAAVDHIEEYWRGGKKIEENARLAHRYCNEARRDQ